MRSRICPYREFCKNECADCDFSITFEKQKKKIKTLEQKLRTAHMMVDALYKRIEDLEIENDSLKEEWC